MVTNSRWLCPLGILLGKAAPPVTPRPSRTYPFPSLPPSAFVLTQFHRIFREIWDGYRSGPEGAQNVFGAQKVRFDRMIIRIFGNVCGDFRLLTRALECSETVTLTQAFTSVDEMAIKLKLQPSDNFYLSTNTNNQNFPQELSERLQSFGRHSRTIQNIQ